MLSAVPVAGVVTACDRPAVLGHAEGDIVLIDGQPTQRDGRLWRQVDVAGGRVDPVRKYPIRVQADGGAVQIVFPEAARALPIAIGHEHDQVVGGHVEHPAVGAGHTGVAAGADHQATFRGEADAGDDLHIAGQAHIRAIEEPAKAAGRVLAGRGGYEPDDVVRIHQAQGGQVDLAARRQQHTTVF